MSRLMLNPRSELHALKPYGEGSADVESLLSLFCRLAQSHSVSTLVLSRTIASHFQYEIDGNFDWHERQIAGIREAACTWSASLSALTSEPSLDRLTFLPWRDVVSQNGLTIHKQGQFCPACFFDDREQGRSPYFRLTWELSQFSVCPRHEQHLTSSCPSCGCGKVRHSAAFVVPGWCTHCGHFLGNDQRIDSHRPIKKASLWRAKQLGDLVAAHSMLPFYPSRETLISTLEQLISQMDHGKSSAFAKRLGIAKSTVHHWLKGDGTPTLETSLQIATYCGLSLTNLLTGHLLNWLPPETDHQLQLMFEPSVSRSRQAPRKLDWKSIEVQLGAYLLLPTPVSVLEVARQLGIEARQLYLRANKTTRQLADRCKKYRRKRYEAHVVKAWPYLERTVHELLAEGKAVTRREIMARVPNEILAPIANLSGVLNDVKAHIAASASLVGRSPID